MRDRSEDAFSPLKLNSEAAEGFVDDANTDCVAVASTIAEDCLEVAEGDLSSLEKRLISQTTTLDVMFTHLATKAASALDWSDMEAAERHLKWALKAQQQSANTMKILIDLKQPKHLTIAKQANVAQQQYIHNSGVPMAVHAQAHGEKFSSNQNQTNELIQIGEVQHATLDSGITETTLKVNAKADS